MHYAYIDNGLPANVVPDIAKTNYFIRSYLRSRTEDASERVDNCARGAALMTDTTVDIELVASCSEMKVNRVLTELYYDAMTQVPTPTYTPEELDFAKQITEEAGLINDGTLFSGLEPLEDEPGRYDYRTERYALCCKMYGRRYEIIDGNTGKY